MQYVVNIGYIQVRQSSKSCTCMLPSCSLNMPSTTSSVMHEIEEIPLPEVPQEVLQLETLEEQVAEMQEWFRAWAEQDHSIRDYRPYFKPLICYMEGSWVYPDLVELDGFPSDRHFIDAENWYDLQDKIRLVHRWQIKGDND